MATKEDGRIREEATEDKQETIINNTTNIENNTTTIQNLTERIVNARRTCRYYTSEVNSITIAGNILTLNFPGVDLPEGATVHHAWLIMEGCLVDTSGAANHLTGGTLQIQKDGGGFWGATPVTRCPYEIQANGVVAIKLTANVGPPGGIVPSTNPDGTYTARITGATVVGASLLFNGHWILEIEYSV